MASAPPAGAATPTALALRADPWWWLALAAGPVAWLLLRRFGAGGALTWPPALWAASPGRFAALALVYPVLEEMVFRGAVQPALRGWLAGRRTPAPGTLANIATSLAFALAHLAAHPPAWALATFFPSLVFGWFRDRHGGLAAPVMLHVVYNAGYFLLVG